MILDKRKKEDGIKTEDRILLEELFTVKQELDNVRQKFEYVTEPEMVASIIYQMQSVQERYSYLLGCVRSRDLSLQNRGEILWKE